MEQHRHELEAEGVEVRPDFTVSLEEYQWWPDPLARGPGVAPTR
jgi:hypothetical protein